MKVTFEDAWHNRLPNSDDPPDLLPEIEYATQADKQVAVTRRLRGEREPPARSHLQTWPAYV